MDRRGEWSGNNSFKIAITQAGDIPFGTAHRLVVQFKWIGKNCDNDSGLSCNKSHRLPYKSLNTATVP